MSGSCSWGADSPKKGLQGKQTVEGEQTQPFPVKQGRQVVSRADKGGVYVPLLLLWRDGTPLPRHCGTVVLNLWVVSPLGLHNGYPASGIRIVIHNSTKKTIMK